MMDDCVREFSARKFGMFIHWGLYSLPGGRWNGVVMPCIGEWFQSYFRMPGEEYAKFAANFNPVKFDADEWMRKAAAAGVTYIVFTSKHHDGFAMYESKVSDYNIVRMTPFKRDPLKELSLACQKYGIKLGIYYSQNLDWHEPDADSPDPAKTLNVHGMHWGNDWDFPDNAKKDFSCYFYGKVIPQVTELLTNYGQVWELWCDCPLNMPEKYSRELRAIVKKLQPQCMINSRIGNNCHDFRGLGDNQMLIGQSQLPVEAPGTLNRTWGFKYDDHDWKSAEQVVRQLLSLNDKNANYLLNIGPMADGSWTPETDAVFAGVARWIKEKKQAIHGSGPNPFQQELDFAYVTTKEHTLNFFLKEPQKTLRLAGIRSRITGASVPYTVEADGTLVLQLPDFKNELLPLVTVDFEGELDLSSEILVQNGEMILGTASAEMKMGDIPGDTERVVIDEAGIRHIISLHAKREASGAVCHWENTVDELSWPIHVQEPGTYELFLRTQKLWKDQKFDAGRRMAVDWNGRHVENDLTESVEATDAEKRVVRLTRLGSISVDRDEAGTLTLTTKRIDNLAAAELCFTAVILRRQ